MARLLALSGGVGGAKLALGLADVLAPGQLTVVANTADDFQHLGLTICPDIDTLLYTLSDRAHPQQGWGLADETFRVLDALAELGGEDWFRLGDKDLATHLLRSQLLREGMSLSDVTAHLAQRMAVPCNVLPMSDQPVSTTVLTEQGELSFQRYFVGLQCEPRCLGFRFEGIERARPAAAVLATLADPDLRGVVICPSNPLVSIDPVLAVPGLWPAIEAAAVPVLAVTPVIQGAAVKGPTAKMLAELGMPVSALGVAQHYAGRLQHFVLDDGDATLRADIEALGQQVSVTATLMKTRNDKQTLARHVLDVLQVKPE